MRISNYLPIRAGRWLICAWRGAALVNGMQTKRGVRCSIPPAHIHSRHNEDQNNRPWFTFDWCFNRSLKSAPSARGCIASVPVVVMITQRAAAEYESRAPSFVHLVGWRDFSNDTGRDSVATITRCCLHSIVAPVAAFCAFCRAFIVCSYAASMFTAIWS